MKSPHWLRNITLKLLLAGCACTVLVLAMAAQETSESKTASGQPEVQVKVERGEVFFVEGNDLIVKMDDGMLQHFTVPDDKKITVDGRELSVHDLKPGMKLERTVTTTTTPQVVTTVKTVQGKVLMVNPPKTVTLQLEDGTAKVYNVPKDQKFTIEGQEKTVFDLKKGMVVSANVITETPTTVAEQTRKVTGEMPPPPPPPPAEAVLLVEQAPAPPVETAKAEPPPEPAPKKLPQTASPLPFITLLGTLMMAAGFGARIIRPRVR
ncbi:MAG TPA: hypothetical protein VFF39_12885 [Verrucomicrobiae bacterium]|nr:hypothetical protein [Verrucomicrobiae bacterium]